MPLIIPGSTRLGPAASGSSITSLPAYLASIGKNSFYARFVAGTNMYVNSDKTGGAVTLNGTVGSWEAEAANTSNFTAYWTQANAANRPHYATANSINSLYSSTNNPAGVGDTRHLQLSSTTALNGAYSVLVRLPLLERDGRAPYSHNNVLYFTTGTGGGSLITAVVGGGSTVADQVIHVVRNTPGTSTGNALVGMSQTGTGHNNAAPYVLRRATTYSASAISELWLVPQLTALELDAAMTYIT